MTDLELVLKEEGLLDGLLKRAQEVGMTLVDYLRLASDVAPAARKADLSEEEEEEPDAVMMAIWERMKRDKAYHDRVVYAPSSTKDDYLVHGEEARELCRD